MAAKKILTKANKISLNHFNVLFWCLYLLKKDLTKDLIYLCLLPFAVGLYGLWAHFELELPLSREHRRARRTAKFLHHGHK